LRGSTEGSPTSKTHPTVHCGSVTPTALYRSTGALERPIGTVSPEPEPSGGLVTAGGLLIAGLLIGGLLLMRSRLLRR
jgi:hypothetical protein